jgi:hypothetical protein
VRYQTIRQYQQGVSRKQLRRKKSAKVRSQSSP